MAKPTICTHSSAPAKARPAATSAPPANMMSTRSTDRISTTPSSSAAPSHQTHAMVIPFVGRPPRSYRSRTFPWGSVGAALPTAARESSAERAGAPPLAVLLNHELDAERLGQVLGCQDVGQRAGRADAPSPQQQGVREADGDLLHVVGDQHHHRRAEVAGQLRQGLQELLPPAEVQARGGFVEQQQLRIGHQRTGDLGARLLALAERPERPVGELVDGPLRTRIEGERKRAQIARALMTDPELLLLDEPAAGLDLGGREELLQALTELASDLRSPVMVLVTHHVEEIPVGFTHALLLRAGRVHAAGPLADVLTPQQLSETFGIELVVEQHGQRWSARALG